MAPAAKQPKTESEVLVPDAPQGRYPVSWGKEIRILRVVKDVLQELMETGVFKTVAEGETVAPGHDEDVAMKIMTLLFDKGPGQLTEAASAICGQEKEWVEENLQIEDIIEVLVPFLQRKQELIVKALRPYMSTMTEALESAKATRH
jgi:hypothetical protein